MHKNTDVEREQATADSQHADAQPHVGPSERLVRTGLGDDGDHHHPSATGDQRRGRNPDQAPDNVHADDRVALSTATPDELASVLTSIGQPQWRAQQLRDACWQPFIVSLEDVHQLPRDARSALAERLAFATATVAHESLGDNGNTMKLLCRLHDGQTVETVVMETPATPKSRRRATVCVSSQVGCAVGCPFCATGQMGLRRHCTAAEIVDQVRLGAQALHAHGFGLTTHVVYMGMGEPLANFDAVAASIRSLKAAGISPRRITVSTSGVVPGIERLQDEGLPVTLAVSLHASTDALRTKLVPMNRKYPLGTLVDAARRYATTSGRRITLEWCLIGGQNDSVEEARGLRNIAQQLRAHVNVIPMNHIDGSPWGPPPDVQRRAFMAALEGTIHTVRDTRGADRDAACGQLRAALDVRRRVGPDGNLLPPRRQA